MYRSRETLARIEAAAIDADKLSPFTSSLWGVLIEQIVHVVSKEQPGVVEAGNGEDLVEQVWPTEEQVGRVHGPHGAAKGHDPLVVPVPQAA